MRRKLFTASGAVVVLLLLALSWSRAAAPTTRPAAKSSAEAQAYLDRDITVHVLNRCAFGPKPRQITQVFEKGWKKWIEEQLEPEKVKDDALDKKIAERWPSLRMELVEMWHTYSPSYDEMMMTGPGGGGGGAGAGEEISEEKRRELQRKRNELRYKIERELRDSVVLRAVESERQLNEVVVEFWRNHLFVDNLKDELVYLAPSYEESVIRAHAFGRFENMLLASASHPAMLIYLDNVISQRPLTAEEEKRIARWNPSQGRKPRSVAALERHPGLNENYARELLELHTFGADNGYTQGDVYELARVLTGWSVDKARDKYGFYFRADYHDKLPKQLVGLRVTGNGGVEEGVGVIRHLARHPNTANFISWKLCRYFVNDEPPVALVKKVATTFRQTGGDLRKVYKEILLSPEFANRDHFKSKFKTPFEFVVSSVRAAGATVEETGAIHGYLARMGQPIYACDDPTGYYDQAEAWCDPGVLVHRWDFAVKLAGNRLNGIKVPETFYAPLVELEPEEIKNRLVANITPNGIDEKTSQALTDYAERSMGGPGGVQRMFGLLLGSPAFQQQ
jgi:uncharacterized protein (DUF1800 family)